MYGLQIKEKVSNAQELLLANLISHPTPNGIGMKIISKGQH